MRADQSRQAIANDRYMGGLTRNYNRIPQGEGLRLTTRSRSNPSPCYADRPPHRRRCAVVVIGAAPMNAQQDAQDEPGPPPIPLAAEAVAHPPGLPAIGRWMIARDGTIAHWLGETVDGKRLHEPINVILIDEGATSPDDAKQRLVAAATAAGFPGPLRTLHRLSRLYRRRALRPASAGPRRRVLQPHLRGEQQPRPRVRAASLRRRLSLHRARSAASASISCIGPRIVTSRSMRRATASRAASTSAPPSRRPALCRSAMPSTMRR